MPIGDGGTTGGATYRLTARYSNVCLDYPIAFPFAEGPTVRFHLPPAASHTNPNHSENLEAAAQPCLISPHQTAIALDIRCEDRGRLSFDGVRFQGSGWFTEGFDTADLKETKALLAELA